MPTLNIKYGLQRAIRTYPQPPTVAQLKQDSALRAELGYGDNINVLVNSVAQPDFAPIQSESVTIETAVNSKA